MLTAGFAAAVAVWCAWFITHIPWLGMPEQISLPVLLGVWLVMAIMAYRVAGVDPAEGGRGGLGIGAGAGAVAAGLGLLVLGSKLGEPSSGFGALKPATGVIALGFIGLGTVIGVVGAAVAKALPRPLAAPAREGGWLSRLAIVAVFAVAPLLFVGGLVTSTNSGMAVPDWPNTFGSNMFLFPLGPRAAPDVYLEHSHRLFGTLVGLTVLTLMIGVLRNDDRRWVRRWAVAAFVLVCAQGVLGGVRVTENSRLLAMMHGVLAQLLLAMLVALAVFLAPTYRALRLLFDGSACRCGYSLAGLEPGADRVVTCPECGLGSQLDKPPMELDDEMRPMLRRLRFLATGAAHITIMQLIFGAMYRHFRSDHALWTHAGFSVLVLIFALAAGFATMPLHAGAGRVGTIVRAMGKGLVVVVGLQFLLGWVTFAVGGRGHEAAGVAQALIRTVHQANGALLLALATGLYMWARPLAPRALIPSPASTSGAAPARA